MADLERRIMGAKRIWKIASEKNLDDIYRCVFGWDDAEPHAPERPYLDDLDSVLSVSET